MTISNVRYMTYQGSDPQPGFVTGYVDTAADLPTVAAIQSAGNVDPLPGSAFTTCDDGRIYLLDSSGTWHVKAGEIYSNVYTQSEVDTLLAAKADASDVYTKIETDALFTAFELLYELGAGITATAENPVDLNTYLTPGVWRSTDAATSQYISHLPADIQHPNGRGFRIIVERLSNNNYIRQTIIPAWNANAADQYYIRHYRGTGSPPQQGWSNWYLYAGTDTGS